MAGESEIGDLKLPYLTRTEGRSLTPISGQWKLDVNERHIIEIGQPHPPVNVVGWTDRLSHDRLLR